MTNYLKNPYSAIQHYAFVILTIVVLISAGGTLAGCTSDGNMDEPEVLTLSGSGNIDLIKVETIVLDPDEQIFGRFHEYMEVDEDSSILLFVDFINQKNYLFDRQGKLVNIIGETGSGPEEFLQIISFDIDKDRIVIADESLYVVKVFSIDGQLLRNFRLFNNEELVISSFGAHVNDQWLYVPIIETKYMHNRSESAVAAKININTGVVSRLIGQYEPFIKQYKHHHAVQRFAIDDAIDQMVTSLNGSPRIQIFDLKSNKRIKYVVADIPEWKQLEDRVDAETSRQESQALTVGTSHIHRIFVNDQWIFQAFQTLTEEFIQTRDPMSKKNYLALYDREGSTFYGSVILPGLPAAVHNNQLFVIENMNPDQYTIGIYELEME